MIINLWEIISLYNEDSRCQKYKKSLKFRCAARPHRFGVFQQCNRRLVLGPPLYPTALRAKITEFEQSPYGIWGVGMGLDGVWWAAQTPPQFYDPPR